jgi:hypothetical protein
MLVALPLPIEDNYAEEKNNFQYPAGIFDSVTAGHLMSYSFSTA